MEDVFPQVVFTVAGIPVRNTVTSTWFVMAVIVILVLVLRRTSPTFLEMVIEAISDMLSDVMGDSVRPYLPLLGALFIFLFVANISSIVPLVITPTRDVNTPLALAVIVFFSVHYYGIKEKGAWNYFKDLASPIFMLPLEVVSQLSRTISLAIRLFGNIISTDLVVAVLFALVPLCAPIPMMGLNMFTGVLQAYIFTMLAAVYIGTAVEESA